MGLFDWIQANGTKLLFMSINSEPAPSYFP